MSNLAFDCWNEIFND